MVFSRYGSTARWGYYLSRTWNGKEICVEFGATGGVTWLRWTLKRGINDAFCNSFGKLSLFGMQSSIMHHSLSSFVSRPSWDQYYCPFFFLFHQQTGVFMQFVNISRAFSSLTRYDTEQWSRRTKSFSYHRLKGLFQSKALWIWRSHEWEKSLHSWFFEASHFVKFSFCPLAGYITNGLWFLSTR